LILEILYSKLNLFTQVSLSSNKARNDMSKTSNKAKKRKKAQDAARAK
jgi:hypothetical protein